VRIRERTLHRIVGLVPVLKTNGPCGIHGVPGGDDRRYFWSRATVATHRRGERMRFRSGNSSIAGDQALRSPRCRLRVD